MLASAYGMVWYGMGGFLGSGRLGAFRLEFCEVGCD
jgi:hypothetical protein